MHILFVCRGNVARSQIAEAVFVDAVRGIHTASSAGTKVFSKEGESREGQKLHEVGGNVPDVLSAMREFGIDISNKERNQLSESLCDQADKIIVMAEPETVPAYLSQNPKTEFWDIQYPKGKDNETTRLIRDDIVEHVRKLTEAIKPKEL